MLWFEYYKRPSGGSPLAAECQGRWLVFYLPTFEIKLLVYWLFYSIAGACACRCSVKAAFDLCSLSAMYMITPILFYYFTLWRPPPPPSRAPWKTAGVVSAGTWINVVWTQDSSCHGVEVPLDLCHLCLRKITHKHRLYSSTVWRFPKTIIFLFSSTLGDLK